MKILNFGSLNFDHVYNVEEFPIPGETIDSISYEKFLGGKGLNQSIAMSRCGVMVHHAGAIGQDGVALKEVLKQNKVNTSYIKQSRDKTGHALVQVNALGENCIILYPGANFSITKEDIDNVLCDFKKGDILLLQNEISNLAYLLERAHALQMRIILNPAPFTEQIKEATLDNIEYMILNESEAMSLSKASCIKDAIEFLKCTYTHTAFIITLGKHGSYFFKNDKTIYQESFDVPVVDTTSAGDTFIGYFIGCLTLGKDIKECLRLASIAASITITRKGSSNTIPDMNEVVAFTQR